MTVFSFPKGLQAMPRRGPKSVWSGRCSARFSEVLPRFSVPTCSNCPIGRPEAPVVPLKFSREAALVPAASNRPLLKSKLPAVLRKEIVLRARPRDVARRTADPARRKAEQGVGYAVAEAATGRGA